MLIPVKKVAHNFIGTYLVFYLCIPFLNILVRNMNEKQHLRLLGLCSFIYIFLGTVPGFSVTMNYVSWYMVLYFIASYIRLYPRKIYDNTALWGWLTLLSYGLSALSILLLTRRGVATGKDLTYMLVTDSNALLAVTNGVCSFMFFKNLKIRHSRFINTVAASTFGVLLIHANSDTMRDWLWKDVLDCVGHYDSPHLVAYAFGSVAAVFAVCTCIDILRRNLLEKPLFNWWEKKGVKQNG